MYYLIFEFDTIHQNETPKDTTQLSKIYYQLVDAQDLKSVLEVPGSLDVLDLGLQNAVGKLESDISARINGDNFVLCSLFSTWHLRVTLIRQAYDCNVVLPSFLQHAKVFDLWREYDRWLVNHPEVSAGNGKAKLNDPSEIYIGLEIDDGNLANEPRIDQAVKILVKLHEKCVSQEDQCTVLTHPYDSYADTLNFMQERSKVLYMNNLPPDTTQSELESWFTHFGSRPVGFWTVKNVVEDTSNLNNNWSSNNSRYVEEHDSISGFVVFQTHEEANDGLALNGRSILSNMANTKQPKIVEHVVEIKPSSNRVLDCAHEILSPFPQSKNKPRPGDWNCPSCGFSNFQRRIACFRCSFPATTAVTVNKIYKPPQQQRNFQHQNQQKQQQQQQQSQHMQIQQQPMKMGMQLQAGMQQYKSSSQHGLQSNAAGYQQQQQHYQTQHHANKQQMAMSAGNSAGSDTQRRYNRYSRMGGQGGNGSNNNTGGNSINTGSNIPFRSGDWKCLNCAYHNFAKNIVCLRCGNPKIVDDESSCSVNSSMNSYGSLSLNVQGGANSTTAGMSLDSRPATALSDKQLANGINNNEGGVNNDTDGTEEHRGFL
ncbi:HGL292Wp [Eremothecium sinecaudum]|uniref:HGL292Wp n=1 Tax=Eremothecium sinecaudum TaxID=45286 RepID=A0A109UZU9_9SACH|nr:HGL292Wp [Eremothecium sinecaudum]AMD22048.1 HGL292Wp [Eremothecium sinecaudum]